jgi:membrane-anchored protein YejM (alkaline phosphatase superfamily)
MLYFSKDREPAEYDYWTAHYDIVPTIMEDVFKVKNEESDYSVGHTLFEDSKRDFLLVDSYIGYGMIDERGNITNILYGGECEILDNRLNERYERSFDEALYKKIKGQIEAFYSSGAK